MLIVSKGKVVIDRKIIGLGGELDGLTPEAEEQLIAAGVAKRVNAPVAPEPAAKEPTKTELQERCRELGVSDKGNKDELKARIAEAEAEAEKEPEEIDDEEPPALSAEVPR